METGEKGTSNNINIQTNQPKKKKTPTSSHCFINRHAHSRAPRTSSARMQQSERRVSEPDVGVMAREAAHLSPLLINDINVAFYTLTQIIWTSTGLALCQLSNKNVFFCFVQNKNCCLFGLFFTKLQTFRSTYFKGAHTVSS